MYFQRKKIDNCNFWSKLTVMDGFLFFVNVIPSRPRVLDLIFGHHQTIRCSSGGAAGDVD